MTLTRQRTYLRIFILLVPLILICACGGSSPSSSISPPQTLEFVYVSNFNGTISAFQIGSTAQIQEIAGSPFAVPGGAGGELLVDPHSRFLLVEGTSFVPVSIETSHALTFTSNAKLLPGFDLMDPLGRFFFANPAEFPPNPLMHVYSVTADLSFPAVPGSPFDTGIQPAAIDPAGKFIFGFNSNEVATVQISSTGSLIKTSTVPATEQVVNAYVHPSGAFLYIETYVFDGVHTHYNIYVYNINSAGVLTPVASETNFTPDMSIQFIAFHPSGKFVFSNRCPPCQLDTLSIDQTTGLINPAPVFSFPGQWTTTALDNAGARLFAVTRGVGEDYWECTLPGVLTVFAVSTKGQLQPISTAQTRPCPRGVVVTQ